MAEQPIYVTQPSLAPLEEYLPYLRQIWSTGVMTHNGPLLLSLEAELCRALRVAHAVCLANGTILEYRLTARSKWLTIRCYTLKPDNEETRV